MMAPMRELTVVDEAALARLAAGLARAARAGDAFLLRGALGMGKTSFARAFIRARARDESLDVPSPTFTLVQHYELDDGAVWHLDLYRLKHPDEARELAIEEAWRDIALIEWPERLGDRLPDARVEIELRPGARDGARRVRVTGFGARGQALVEAIDHD
jgi:tRNA threonylcarbamoyladenosine biosynthesis protein TsaE